MAEDLLLGLPPSRTTVASLPELPTLPLFTFPLRFSFLISPLIVDAGSVGTQLIRSPVNSLRKALRPGLERDSTAVQPGGRSGTVATFAGVSFFARDNASPTSKGFSCTTSAGIASLTGKQKQQNDARASDCNVIRGELAISSTMINFLGATKLGSKVLSDILYEYIWLLK